MGKFNKIFSPFIYGGKLLTPPALVVVFFMALTAFIMAALEAAAWCFTIFDFYFESDEANFKWSVLIGCIWGIAVWIAEITLIQYDNSGNSDSRALGWSIAVRLIFVVGSVAITAPTIARIFDIPRAYEVLEIKNRNEAERMHQELEAKFNSEKETLIVKYRTCYESARDKLRNELYVGKYKGKGPVSDSIRQEMEKCQKISLDYIDNKQSGVIYQEIGFLEQAKKEKIQLLMVNGKANCDVVSCKKSDYVNLSEAISGLHASQSDLIEAINAHNQDEIRRIKSALIRNTNNRIQKIEAFLSSQDLQAVEEARKIFSPADMRTKESGAAERLHNVAFVKARYSGYQGKSKPKGKKRKANKSKRTTVQPETANTKLQIVQKLGELKALKDKQGQVVSLFTSFVNDKQKLADLASDDITDVMPEAQQTLSELNPQFWHLDGHGRDEIYQAIGLKENTENTILGVPQKEMIAYFLLVGLSALILILKLRSPAGLKIYYDAMLQEKFLSYQNGLYNSPAFIVDSNEYSDGLSPMAPYRFKEWFYKSYLPTHESEKVRQDTAIKALLDKAHLIRLDRETEIKALVAKRQSAREGLIELNFIKQQHESSLDTVEKDLSITEEEIGVLVNDTAMLEILGQFQTLKEQLQSQFQAKKNLQTELNYSIRSLAKSIAARNLEITDIDKDLESIKSAKNTMEIFL